MVIEEVPVPVPIATNTVKLKWRVVVAVIYLLIIEKISVLHIHNTLLLSSLILPPRDLIFTKR